MPDVSTELDLGSYVYAIVPVSGQVAGLRGIDGAEVEYVVHGDLAAAVSAIPLNRPPGRKAELTAHHTVVEALAKEGPAVPVRFGSVLETAATGAEMLARDDRRYQELLEQLVGRVQFNLQASYVEEQVLAEVVAADPEIADLRRRTRQLPAGTMHPDLVLLGEKVARAVEVRAAEDSAALLDHVVPIVEERSIRPGGGMNHVLDVALLVRNERAKQLESVLESLAEAWHERIRLRLVGPVAPYDFVEVEAWG